MEIESLLNIYNYIETDDAVKDLFQVLEVIDKNSGMLMPLYVFEKQAFDLKEIDLDFLIAEGTELV